MLKRVGLEMTLERAQSRIYSKIGWQTVPCSWSIDGEAALTGRSPGARDQQSPKRRGHDKNRRDVVVTTSPGDQAGSRILHRLESLK